MNEPDKKETMPLFETESSTAAQPPAIDSSDLFANGNEVWIEHHGERYRLQRTKAGKLILTK